MKYSEEIHEIAEEDAYIEDDDHEMVGRDVSSPRRQLNSPEKLTFRITVSGPSRNESTIYNTFSHIQTGGTVDITEIMENYLKTFERWYEKSLKNLDQAYYNFNEAIKDSLKDFSKGRKEFFDV